MSFFTWENLRKTVVYEDNEVLVLDKPVGISVIGDAKGDIVQLAEKAGKKLFPVHRIDKETSGAILFAKNQQTHGILTRQFNKRTVKKAYLAIVRGVGLPLNGTIQLPLSEGRKNTVRVAAHRENIQYDKENNVWFVPKNEAFKHIKTYPSVTKFIKLFESYAYTVLLVNPQTGRRHQIRVHLAWIGYPIEGDSLFVKTPETNRMHLHSFYIEFTEEWKNGKRISAKALPGEDFWRLIPNSSIENIVERANEILHDNYKMKEGKDRNRL